MKDRSDDPSHHELHLTPKSNLGARRTRTSLLQNAIKIKLLPKRPTHDAMLDNKYMKLFDAIYS